MKTTHQVLKELNISNSTLYRIRKALKMFSKVKKRKYWYSEEEFEEIKKMLYK
jgi:hypothetical protein